MNNKYLFRNRSFRLIFLLLSFWPKIIIAQYTSFDELIEYVDKNGHTSRSMTTFYILSEEEATCALGDGNKTALSKLNDIYQIEIPPVVSTYLVDHFKEYTVIGIADNAFQPFASSSLYGRIGYPNPWLKKLILPNTVKYIGSLEAGLDSLEHLVLPSNLETIGDRAFYGQQLVDTLYIPSSVREIGNSAFFSWRELTLCAIFEPNTNIRLSERAFGHISNVIFKEPCNITLSEYAFINVGNEYLNLPIGLEEIPRGCFMYMHNLKMLIIHDKVKKIESEAFAESDWCQPVIISEASEPCECDEDAFTNPRHDYFDGTLIVPDGSKEKYLNATGWNKITTIIEQHEAVGITNMMSGSKSRSMQAFNLSGRRISALQKGIFILNGKKILVK